MANTWLLEMISKGESANGGQPKRAGDGV